MPSAETRMASAEGFDLIPLPVETQSYSAIPNNNIEVETIQHTYFNIFH